jgi:hypothetical protein
MSAIVPCAESLEKDTSPMKRSATHALFILVGALALGERETARGMDVDLSGYRAECGVEAAVDSQGRLTLRWPFEAEQGGQIVLDTREGQPLIEQISLGGNGEKSFHTILRSADPTVFVVVGERRAPGGRPPQMSVFNVFFDSPAERPHRSHRSKLEKKHIRVSSHGRHATVAVGDLSVGPFRGELQITVYPGSRLVQLEAVVKTQEERRAFVYDLGLMSESAIVDHFSWIDTDGLPQHASAASPEVDRPIAVRHRLIVAGAEGGAIACFPPPHQYFYPRDLTDNQSTAWYGRDHRGLDGRFGFGIRQTERGGGAFVPWFNAPPGTEQRLGMFLLLAHDDQEATRETLRYTHGDRFPRLPGYHTFTSHFHMAISVAAMAERARGGPRSIPDFVTMFKDMGVEMVHLAEFHGDGHPGDPGPIRLPELRAMFDECRRLSDDRLLLLPGEEANSYLGLPAPGRHAGHWVYLFPRPVTWTMNRAAGQPFREDLPGDGSVYHVGSRDDMMRLLEAEDGLAWTSHPRIKASSWTPDVFRDEDFFISPRWLGAAWKAMPADLSHDRLGRRALDLFDDMENWGRRKYVLGEADVFKLDHRHELYGHMNINYLQLDRVPRYEEDWKPVLDALRNGRFFVSTGEVLIPAFSVDGQGSGSKIALGKDGKAEIRVSLEGTFPLRFAELISGDGTSVHRQRIDLSECGPFARKDLSIHADLVGRKWIRLEAWDIACNGAFTQPVWIEPKAAN